MAEDLLFSLSPADLAGAGLAIFVAGLLRGFTGFGFALAAVPLAGLVLPPAMIVPVVMLTQLVIGSADAVRERRAVDWRLVGWLTLGLAIATPLGTWALVALPGDITRIVIACIVLLGAAAAWRPPRAEAAGEGGLLHARITRLGVGLVAGLFTGLAAMPGPPVVAYMLAAERDPRIIRATLMVFFFFTAVTGCASAWFAGLIGWPELVMSAAALPLVVGGSAIGAAGFRRADARHYRPAALVVLVGAAMVTIGREIF